MLKMQERGAQALEGLSTSSQDVGSTEVLQQAVQRGKDSSGKMMEQQRGNAQHSAKPKGVEPQKCFPEARAHFQPTCCRITPGTKLCLMPNAHCSREV